MQDTLAVGNLIIEVGLHAAKMGMSRHCVPNTTLLQLGDTHLKLAGAHAGNTVDDQLMDDTSIALLKASCHDVVGILECHLLCGVGLVSTG